MKRWCLIFLAAVFLLSGCSMETQDEKKLQDLEFTVLDPEKIPEVGSRKAAAIVLR